jgi:hypothetical protein
VTRPWTVTDAPLNTRATSAQKQLLSDEGLR